MLLRSAGRGISVQEVLHLRGNVLALIPVGGTSSVPRCGEPVRGLASDLGWDHVAALELPVAHLVAGVLEPGDDSAAAAVDRQPPVPCSVGDEDPRAAPPAGR